MVTPFLTPWNPSLLRDGKGYPVNIIAPFLSESECQSGDRTITDRDFISGMTTLSVSGTLSFGSGVVVAPNARLDAVAGDEIRLLPGFQAKGDSRFSARIGAVVCD